MHGAMNGAAYCVRSTGPLWPGGGYGRRPVRRLRIPGRAHFVPAVWGVLLAVVSDPQTTHAAIRPPAVAGSFYPDDPVRLRRAIEGFLADAVPARLERPIALVAPHAGYAYSGQIAADAYAQARSHATDLVVLLGANHTSPRFHGFSLWNEDGYRTPLGVASVDAAAAAALLAASSECTVDPEVHAREHSIEVHVPFVQVVFPAAKILPVVVGADDPERCARFGRALASALAGRRALVVASCDLAHYPAHEDAVASDHAVLSAMASLDAAALERAIATSIGAGRPGLATCACGEAPVLVAMAAARALGATRGTVVSAATSGDTSIGDRTRVVGYGAVAFAGGPPGTDVTALGGVHPGGVASSGRDVNGAVGAATVTDLSPGDREALLGFARRTLERWFTTSTPPLARGFSPAARRAQGGFVTLYVDGALRGCIGHMAEDRPLDQVVGAMTLAAAFEDRRFAPLEAQELARLEIEISALTPLQPVERVEDIVVGRDGVQLRKAGRTAVFLPQVPVEQGWDRTALLENLCRKAGLPPDGWKSGAQFATFRSVHFRESEFRPSGPRGAGPDAPGTRSR